MDKVIKFLDSTFLDLGRQFKWTYLPPLMVYMAAGISGLTGIVGTFFVKDYLNLSAAFLAGLGFWAGIPWALKMPLGHLVDLIWERKNYMVYFGASLIALSLLIMYGLIIHTEDTSEVFSVETWFVISVILAPVGYVVQDVVADAMTVEAVPLVDEIGNDYSKDQIKIMHTTMQTLGRFAIIGGTVLVALVNVILFPNSQISRFPNFEISKFPDSQVPRFPDAGGAGRTLRSQPDPSANAPRDQIRRKELLLRLAPLGQSTNIT